VLSSAPRRSSSRPSALDASFSSTAGRSSGEGSIPGYIGMTATREQGDTSGNGQFPAAGCAIRPSVLHVSSGADSNAAGAFYAVAATITIVMERHIVEKRQWGGLTYPESRICLTKWRDHRVVKGCNAPYALIFHENPDADFFVCRQFLSVRTH